MLVGAVPSITVTPVEGRLGRGDTLVLYTDGVTDVSPPHGLDPDALENRRRAPRGDRRGRHRRRLGREIEEVLPISERNDDVALVIVLRIGSDAISWPTSPSWWSRRTDSLERRWSNRSGPSGLSRLLGHDDRCTEAHEPSAERRTSNISAYETPSRRARPAITSVSQWTPSSTRVPATVTAIATAPPASIARTVGPRRRLTTSAMAAYVAAAAVV